MKSVSTALEEIHRCTFIGPVTSIGSVERLRLEDEHVGPLGQPRDTAARSRRTAPPRAGRPARASSTSRRRSTGWRKRDHACSMPGPSDGQLADGAVDAADRRHRVGRVVGEAARGGCAGGRRLAARASRRRGGRRPSRPARASGHSCSSRQRPPWSSLPSASCGRRAAAHHEDADRRLARRLAARRRRAASARSTRAARRSSARRPRRCRARSRPRGRTSRRRASRRGSRADHEPLRRRVLCRHRGEVVGVGPGPRVEPARRDGHRDVGVPVEVGGEVALDARPPVVVGAARVVVDQRLLERRDETQRRLAALPRRRPVELAQVPQVVPDLLGERRIVAAPPARPGRG